MEHESHHHHHPHGTGFRWLDISLAVCATVVSLVSLWLGLHSAHSMEKLVAANSYPYLTQLQSASSDKFFPGTERLRNRVQYAFENDGAGPARIDWVQLSFNGKPVADLSALLQACCSATGDQVQAFERRGGVAGNLVRPGAMLSMFSWDEPDKPSPIFDALHRQMKNIRVSYCYCSVFDECYLSLPQLERPQPVEECKAPAVTFRPHFRED